MEKKRRREEEKKRSGEKEKEEEKEKKEESIALQHLLRDLCFLAVLEPLLETHSCGQKLQVLCRSIHLSLSSFIH
jgi:hypothetical protein